MPTIQDFESKITDFTVRVGANTAQRRDLDAAADQDGTEDVQPTFDLDLHLKPGNQFLRIDVDMRVTDRYGSYRTVVSGQWLSKDETAFESAIGPQDPTLEKLLITTLAPQILAVAQAKIIDLARSIDCPPVTFPYDLSVQIRNAQPQLSNPQEEPSEDTPT